MSSQQSNIPDVHSRFVPTTWRLPMSPITTLTLFMAGGGAAKYCWPGWLENGKYQLALETSGISFYVDVVIRLPCSYYFILLCFSCLWMNLHFLNILKNFLLLFFNRDPKSTRFIGVLGTKGYYLRHKRLLSVCYCLLLLFNIVICCSHGFKLNIKTDCYFFISYIIFEFFMRHLRVWKIFQVWNYVIARELQYLHFYFFKHLGYSN